MKKIIWLTVALIFLVVGGIKLGSIAIENKWSEEQEVPNNVKTTEDIIDQGEGNVIDYPYTVIDFSEQPENEFLQKMFKFVKEHPSTETYDAKILQQVANKGGETIKYILGITEPQAVSCYIAGCKSQYEDYKSILYCIAMDNLNIDAIYDVDLQKFSLFEISDVRMPATHINSELDWSQSRTTPSEEECNIVAEKAKDALSVLGYSIEINEIDIKNDIYFTRGYYYELKGKLDDGTEISMTFDKSYATNNQIIAFYNESYFCW